MFKICLTLWNLFIWLQNNKMFSNTKSQKKRIPNRILLECIAQKRLINETHFISTDWIELRIKKYISKRVFSSFISAILFRTHNETFRIFLYIKKKIVHLPAPNSFLIISFFSYKKVIFPFRLKEVILLFRRRWYYKSFMTKTITHEWFDFQVTVLSNYFFYVKSTLLNPLARSKENIKRSAFSVLGKFFRHDKNWFSVPFCFLLAVMCMQNG